MMEYITNNYVILFPISIFYLMLLIASIVDFWDGGNFNGFILVLIFTLYYTLVIHNQQNLAESLQNNNGFIPGIRPGPPTKEYLMRVIIRITWGGALFLGTIAVIPSIAYSWSISEDLLNYKFNLRNDVFFRNIDKLSVERGRKVTADDFEYSLNRLLDNDVA